MLTDMDGRWPALLAILTACGHDAPTTDDAHGDGDARADATTDGASAACSALAATCGPAGTASCCTSPVVPGGTFYRSYDVATDGAHTDMTSPATVSDFRLDTYEVTVARFRQFVAAGQGTQASPPAAGAGGRTLGGMSGQGGWDPAWNASLPADQAALIASVSCSASYQAWTDAPGANESMPMNCVTWYEAFSFCAWDGGFLPTEAQWNYAAAGGSEQRAYPWSSPPDSVAIDCSYANYVDNQGFCNGTFGGVDRVGSQSPKGDGKWGQADLGGNINEWTLDGYAVVYPTPCNDCAALTPVSTSVARGASFMSTGPYLRGALRLNSMPTAVDPSIGARCARRL